MQVLRRDAAQARHRVLLEEGLELRAPLFVDHGHDALQRRIALLQDLRGLGSVAPTGEFPTSGCPAGSPARGRSGRCPAARARRPVRLHRHRAGQRMADVGDRYAFLAVDLFLERKQYQHVRNRLADLVDALIAPRPDRRTDEVHRGRAGLAQLMLQAQVEIRRVDANEHGRRLSQPAPLDVAIGGQQAGQALERVDVRTRSGHAWDARH